MFGLGQFVDAISQIASTPSDRELLSRIFITRTVARFHDLPPELLRSTVSNSFQGIFNLVDPEDLKSVRAVCRKWKNISDPLFGRTFFTILTTSLDSDGLARLAAISSHKILAPHVQTLRFVFHKHLEATNLARTRSQMAQNSTISMLASCLDQLSSCAIFEHHTPGSMQKSTLDQWASIPEMCMTAGYCRCEDLLDRLLWITLEAMALSTTKPKSLIIGLMHNTVWLPHYTTEAICYRNDLPSRQIPIESLTLYINSNVLRAAPVYDTSTFDSRPFFSIFPPHLTSIDIRLGPPLSNEARLACHEVVRCLVKLPKLQNVTLLADTAYNDGTWYLRKLVEYSRGTLRKVYMRGLLLGRRNARALVDVLQDMASQNRALEMVDLGLHRFEQHVDDGEMGVVMEIALRDDRPYAYGALLIEKKITQLRKWLDLVDM